MNNDTICAPATPAGGALGIIRISGSDAIPAVDALFHAANGHPLASRAGYSLSYGTLQTDGGETIDDVVVSLFRAPHSYTGEDSVEITCHGSRYIINKVLEELVRCGCRMARAGEFTERAFLNGKMDLSQAEAVADLIASSNRVTHQIAISQLRGQFSSELVILREQLLHLTTLLELELDFSDHEDLEFANRSELLTLTNTIYTHITQLTHSFKIGQALKQGIPVAIVGKTNVGKSTLLNRLLHDDRAIVSNIHGTTRDTIEDTIDIRGITFRFIDTAGIRQTTDEVEQMGISRTYSAIDKARIVLWLIDEMPTEAEITDITSRCEGRSIIPVWNKTDINSAFCYKMATLSVIPISAKTGQGIPELESALLAAADIPEISSNDVIVTNVRHFEALTHAQDNLQRILEGLRENISGDLISEDLRLVLSDLSEITGGLITSQETLSNIFSHFCVGK